MKEKYYLQSDIAEITKNLEKHLKYFSGKKFLISGANGFLGKYFIKTLINLNKKLKKKTSIVAIDIKFDKCEIYSDKNVKKIKQDINNIRKLISIIIILFAFLLYLVSAVVLTLLFFSFIMFQT